MAKRNDDISFSFSNKKIEPKKPDAPACASDNAQTSDPAADPLATPDPFADPAETLAATDLSPDTAEPVADVEPSAPEPRQHKQFRILILADFAGRTNRGIAEPATISSRKPRAVDVDSLDKTLAAMKPSIQLPIDEKSVIPLTFKAMEDFRPDALLQNIPGLQALLNLRAQLKDQKTFKAAAAALQKTLGTPDAKPAPAPATTEEGESEFERMLQRPLAPKGAANASADAIIANLVSGYGTPADDPQQVEMVKLVEASLSAGLRAILRHPSFQSLEAAWRGVEFLISRLNTDEDLKIYLFDVSKDELYADLSAAPTIEKSAMYQIFVEQTRAAGAVPFSLVVGDYEFDQTPQNIALLAKIASLMHAAEIPFLAGATEKLPGFPSFAKAPDSGKWQPPADLALWEKLRAHNLAAHIGLAAPRFLIRMPYGPKTDAVEAFPLEEMPEPATEQYLWANGAFAVALLIGQAFLDNGWEGIEPGNDVSDLPCHMAVVDGDKEMTPCAQGWLSDRSGDILHNLGIIPLLSVRNAAAVKVAGIHSISKPSKPLAASWAQ